MPTYPARSFDFTLRWAITTARVTLIPISQTAGSRRQSSPRARQHASGLASQAELDAAEAAAAHAYADSRALGAQTLARAGKSVPDVAIEIASSNFGYEQ